MEIYLDHAATTYTDERVLEAMLPYFNHVFGNASSLHGYGRAAEKGVSIAREQTAIAIGADKKEIYFTSGGTESDNWAIKGVAEAKGAGHIITSTVEHHAVLDTCEYLEKRGFEVTYLPVDAQGMVSAQSVANAIREDTILISIMAANNETGTVMPIADIGEAASARGVLFHTDAVQAIGHIDIDVDAMHIDLLSMSAHKFYGPKGVGALYIRQGTDIGKYMHGGSQEAGMRGSTINTPGIVGLGAAIALATEDMEAQAKAETAMAAQLMDGLLCLPATRLNGHKTQRLPGSVNISFEGIEAEALMIRLDMEGIAVSTGSACTSGSTAPSYVLTEMGLCNADARGSVRFTIGRENTPAQIDTVIQTVTQTVENLREISPLFAQKKGGQHYV